MRVGSSRSTSLKIVLCASTGLLAFAAAEGSTTSQLSDDTTGATNPSNLPVECSNPVPNTCTFYSTCLEPRVHCGATGYPLGYGEKFCNTFMADKGEFSQQGQQWLEDVGLCLQKSLVSVATGPEDFSCAELKDFAISTHTKCYIQTGFCAQSFRDQLTLLGIVGIPELFADLATIKSGLDVFIHCLKVDLGLTKGKSYDGSHVDL